MSSRTRRNQGQDWSSTDLVCPVPTNDESAFSWGNGFMASELQSTGGGPDGSGSFSEGLYDMSRNLGTSGTGTGNWWQRGASQQGGYDSFYSGGLGMGYGGGFSGEYGNYGTGMGLGLGGGGGHWDRQSFDAAGNPLRDASGYGGGLGVMGRSDTQVGLFGQQLGYGAEAYRGVGGNAYQFRDEQLGRTGYGVDGNYTPLGIDNAYGNWDTGLGSGSVGMESSSIGRYNASLEGYRTDAGGYGVQGGYNGPRTELRGLTGHSDSVLGETDASLGQMSMGARRYHGGVEVGPDGSVMGNFGYQGGSSGGWGYTDANLSHDFGNGMGFDAHMGKYGGVSGMEATGGWNNTTGNLEGSGYWSRGRRIEDVNVNAYGPGGSELHAGMGSYEQSNRVDIERASVGADGVHVAGGGHWGGQQFTDLSYGAGWRGQYYNEASVGSVGNQTLVDGAHLDLDGNGLDAGVDSVRAGGWRAEDIRAHNELFGVNTDASLGSISNDVMVEGARLNVDGTGVHAGVDNVDWGGFRMEDANLHSDLGGYGNVDAHVGSFSTSDSVKGAQLDITEDGLHAGAEEISLFGIDGADMNYSARGPGGLHSDASLGRLHTGLTANGAYLDANADGLSLGAREIDYSRLSLEDVNASYGMDGIYETEMSLGRGDYMRAGAENVHMGLDENGLGLSADNARFNYLAVEDAHLAQSYFDGAVGGSADIGRGSYLGGSADHFEYQTDLMNSNLSIDGLNAHGLQLEDTHLNANIGDANAHLGADRLDILNLNAGHLEGHTQNYGLQGQGSAEDVRLDLINAEGLGGDIGWGDTTLLGARTDFNSHLGVDSASGQYDLMNGTASGQFENANFGAMTDNTRLEAFGYGLDIGRTGYDVHASGSGDVDLARGAANGDVNFAGTELALFGNSVTLGDWAQAQAGVDMSQGAANVQLGGENGIGADMNLSEGNLDLNAFGYTLDVDETARDVWDGATDLAGDAWDGATSIASDIGSGVASFFSGW